MRGKRKGSSLIEAAVAIALIGIVAAAAVHDTTGIARTRAARATGEAVLQILEAARWRYLDQGEWPATLEQLRSEGYLPQGWTALSPFGTAYSMSSTDKGLRVTVALPDAGLARTAAAAVPAAAVNGTTLAVTTPPPGTGDALDGLLARYGTDQERTMEDDLFLGGNRVVGLGAPTAQGDAMTLGRAESSYIKKTGGIPDGVVNGTLDVQTKLVSSRFYDTAWGSSYYINPAETSYLNDMTATSAGGSLAVARRGGATALQILSATGRPGDWNCVQVMHNHGYPGYPQTWLVNYEAYASLGPVDYAAIAVQVNGAGGWGQTNYWSGSRRYAVETSVLMPFAFGGQLVCY